jgi:rRNA maturation protein Nop10
MDDFIYFLLVIGWLGYSFYKQSEKKKRQQAARNIEQQSGSMPEQPAPVYAEREQKSTEVPTQPDFRKTIEEFLLGEEQTLEEIPQNGPQSLEAIPEPAFSDENKYQKYSYVETSQQPEWQQKMNDTGDKETYRAGNEKAAVFVEEEGDEFWEGFNLRKAVIYSEILNRKYVF